MGSVPSSPSEYKKDMMISSRSSSPALSTSSRSASPGAGIMSKRRSHSRGSDDSAGSSAVRQTKSSNIRRANSVNLLNQTPTTPTHKHSAQRKPTHKSLQRSQTIAESPSPNPKRRPNTLLDHNRNNNAAARRRSQRTQAPLDRQHRDIPVTIVTTS